MRSLLLLLAAGALSAQAPPPDFRPYEQALAGSHLGEAAEFIDKVLAERTALDGTPRPDPLINALMGRLFLAAQNPDVAAPYLDHAPLSALPEALRAATALDHGRALEFRGERAAALAAYREAAAIAATETERRRAAIGIARQLLVDDPAAARNQVLGIAGGRPSPERWEAKYLLALSGSLLGDGQAAARLADEAWADAANARVGDLAPLHVAALRAGLAAARHDRDAQRAMLIATNGMALTAAPALGNQLPICGDRGVRPSDYVIFSFVAGPYATRRLVPVAASRVEAVAPFADALGATVPISEANGTTPLGTVFTVSCRSLVSWAYEANPSARDPLVQWFIERGLYPASASFDTEDKHLNTVADRIDALAARFGKDSPLLIGPRWQMGTILEKRAKAGDRVLPGQLADLGAQVAAGLRRAGAPEWMVKTVEFRAPYQQAAAAADDDPDRIPAAIALFREQLLRVPFPLARPIVVGMLSDFKGDWPPAVAQLVLDLNANASSTMAPRERQAWLLVVARAQRSLGRESAARATLASAGFSRDLCLMSDSDPKLLEQHFSYSDYPHDLVAGQQEGAVLFEFDLSPSGSVAGRRAVYSLPSGIFDEPSAKGLGTVRYTVPTRSGKAASCRGLFQPIRWRLESQDDFKLPALTPDIAGPTT